MTGRRTRMVTDVAITWSVAFLAALSAGRISAWFGWVRDRQSAGDSWWSAVVTVGVVLALVVIAAARTAPDTTDAHVRAAIDGTTELRAAPARLVAMFTGVGLGAPLGPDGPMLYLGGAAGAFVARRTGRPERWLMLAAATSALAMVIDAPVAAACFACEVARRGAPRRRDVVPLALGALAAWVALRLTGEAGGVLGADLGLTLRQTAVGAAAIGLVAGLSGRLVVLFGRRAVEAGRAQGRLGRRVLGAIVLVGVIAPIGWSLTDVPIYLGSGGLLRAWAAHATQPSLLVATVVFAVLVFGLVACGLVGGLFVPMLSLGAVVGLLVGRAWLPDVPYAACVGIGACCLLAAALGAPITAAALAFSSFGWSAAAWATLVAVLLASSVAGERSLTPGQLPRSAGR
ncbi:MAG: chloride channel protein [Acidimicrobiales bacterium]